MKLSDMAKNMSPYLSDYMLNPLTLNMSLLSNIGRMFDVIQRSSVDSSLVMIDKRGIIDNDGVDLVDIMSVKFSDKSREELLKYLTDFTFYAMLLNFSNDISIDYELDVDYSVEDIPIVGDIVDGGLLTPILNLNVYATNIAAMSFTAHSECADMVNELDETEMHNFIALFKVIFDEINCLYISLGTDVETELRKKLSSFIVEAGIENRLNSKKG